mmetsp:Transcript_22223/g.37208  ORF Transcript_22223/g.37208 Transcript_22223/m.37208 type:complete len:80 (+) Transcript_22223:57-296(+)
MGNRFPVLFGAFLLALFVAANAKRTPEECAQLGFASPACDSCDLLAQSVSDDEFIEECKSCCAGGTTTWYTKAKIQVCS